MICNLSWDSRRTNYAELGRLTGEVGDGVCSPFSELHCVTIAVNSSARLSSAFELIRRSRAILQHGGPVLTPHPILNARQLTHIHTAFLRRLDRRIVSVEAKRGSILAMSKQLFH